MSAPKQQHARKVTLLDGATVTLRRLKKTDTDAVAALHTQLSDKERYFRFFIVHPSYLEKCAKELVQRNATHYAVGAFEGDELIGVANYVRADDPAVADVAVAVAHADHFRGVATALLRHLSGVAKRRGIRYFAADVLPQNGPVLDVLRDTGAQVTKTDDGYSLHLLIDLSTMNADKHAPGMGSARTLATSAAESMTNSVISSIAPLTNETEKGVRSIMTETSQKTIVERATELSDEVLQSVESGRTAAIEAVRKFMTAIDKELGALVDSTRRATVINAALDLAEELATARIEFLRSLVRSASQTLKKE